MRSLHSLLSVPGRHGTWVKRAIAAIVDGLPLDLNDSAPLRLEQQGREKVARFAHLRTAENALPHHCHWSERIAEFVPAAASSARG